MKHNNFRIEPVTETVVRIYKRNNENLPIKIDCNNRFYTLNNLYEEYLERIYDFEVRIDDIWVITQPKSGTTWMLELVWLLQNGFDFETALKVHQGDRTPFFEFSTLIRKENPNSFEEVANMPSPRIIKTHLPVYLLPKQLWTVKPKIIYVARDPKDAMVSYYHFHFLMGLFKGSIDEYVDLMINEKLRYCPLGVNTIEFWQLRNLPYVFFMSFERMKKDLRSVILKLSKFLQKYVNEEKMTILLDHLSFRKMKDNPQCNQIKEIKCIQEYLGHETTLNKFIRNGEINSYKTELSERTRDKLEKWNTMQMNTYGVNAEEMLLS